MINVIVIGASGYTGAELCQILHHHPAFRLVGTYVSGQSADQGARLSALYPRFAELNEYELVPLTDVSTLDPSQVSCAFLATPHEYSHDIAPQLVANGIRVADLSGAFRIHDTQEFETAYGFRHQHDQLLSQTPYGLVDFYANLLASASLVAVPGCYPTASLLSLKPVKALLDTQFPAIINAVSGVSGAGRKASLNNSFCEVGMQAYGVLKHRHQPEIQAWLGHPVVFTPHLGTFKRGIIATTTVRLKGQTGTQDVAQAFDEHYSENRLVSVNQGLMPKLDDVIYTPRCHIGWQFDADTQMLVVSAVIDNLLKGASAQAVQTANLMHGLEKDCGL